jgi:hypothetical protein
MKLHGTGVKHRGGIETLSPYFLIRRFLPAFLAGASTTTDASTFVSTTMISSSMTGASFAASAFPDLPSALPDLPFPALPFPALPFPVWVIEAEMNGLSHRHTVHAQQNPGMV